MKVVVILSGGPDSVTLAYKAKSEGYKVYAITFNYGQIAKKEIEFAKIIAEKLEIEQKIVDLSSLNNVFGSTTALMDENITMPSKFEPSVIVPFRNAIFLSVAVAYAEAVGASKILYGAQGSDAPFYPDCRKEFFEAFQTAAQKGTDSQIVIDAPFHNMKKFEIINLGVKLGVPYEITWSCYLNNERQCGVCESCRNRKKGFREANIIDPTKYKK
ncbi:7-cyano-7-deazaguanine synthase QueC [[Eubacterium] cellulosolvens]